MFYIGDSVRFFSSEIPDIFDVFQIIFSQLLHYRVASPWEIDVNSPVKQMGILRGELGWKARRNANHISPASGMFKGVAD